jgi:hypothetical protein
LKPCVVTNELNSEVAINLEYESLLKAVYLVLMDSYQAEALMRFTPTVSYKELSSKANTLIEIAASLNFVSKEFVMANGFYKDCKTAPKLSIRVATEQRISMNE